MTAVAGICLPLIAACLVLRRRHDGWVFVPHILPLALGLSSVVWWILQLLPLPSRRAMIALDVSLWTAAVVVLMRLGSSGAADPPPPGRNGTAGGVVAAAAVFAVTLSLAALSFVASSIAQPHGEWDAWAIWNLRARFLAWGYPELWREAFSPLLAWSHPDYPLLLPLSVARTWIYVESSSVAIPIAIAATFALAIVLAAGLSVRRERSTSRGLLTAVAIMASPAFVKYAPSQCADIPLAFYILGTVLSVADALRAADERRGWIVAGAFAGLAAWTKNEGMLFLAIGLLVVAVLPNTCSARRRLRRAGWMLIGASPMLAAVTLLKGFSSENDVIAAQSLQSVFAALGDVDRVQTVLTSIGGGLWFGGAPLVGVLPALALFAAMSGLRKPVDSGPVLGLAMMALLLLGYTAVYVITPHDLAWHLNTSLDRVLLHAFPTLVWCSMMAIRP